MAVFLNDTVGDSFFGSFADYHTADDPEGIWSIDLNKTGNLDLITTGKSERCIEIFNGDGKGKFYSGWFGYPWTTLHIQDDYDMLISEPSFDKKWQKIRDTLNAARNGDPETMYINFTTGSGGVYPFTVADGEPAVGQGMNQRTYDALRGFETSEQRRVGVIMMDYPGPGLIEAVIALNDLTTSVGDDRNGDLPLDFRVQQNYPNPFNPTTTIECSLPERSHLKIEVFNMLGRRVRTLVDCEKSAGTYTITWDGRSEDLQVVSTGVYFYRFQAGEHVQTKKMLLLK
jgi:hypothetical protein